MPLGNRYLGDGCKVTDQDINSRKAAYAKPRSATQYEFDANGAIRRLTPKMWNSKAERRRVIKERRADRAVNAVLPAP